MFVMDLFSSKLVNGAAFLLSGLVCLLTVLMFCFYDSIVLDGSTILLLSYLRNQSILFLDLLDCGEEKKNLSFTRGVRFLVRGEMHGCDRWFPLNFMGH